MSVQCDSNYLQVYERILSLINTLGKSEFATWAAQCNGKAAWITFNQDVIVSFAGYLHSVISAPAAVKQSACFRELIVVSADAFDLVAWLAVPLRRAIRL